MTIPYLDFSGRDVTPPELRKRLFESLASSPWVTNDFWQRSSLRHSDSLMPYFFTAEIVRRARQIILDPRTSNADLAYACLLLQEHVEKVGYSTPDRQSGKDTELIDALKHQLQRMIQDPNLRRATTSIRNEYDSFGISGLPTSGLIDANLFERLLGTIARFGSEGTHASLLLELLDLVTTIDAADALRPELESIQQLTNNGFQSVVKISFTQGSLIRLTWPGLVMTDSSIPVAQRPTPEDWLDTFAHVRTQELLGVTEEVLQGSEPNRSAAGPLPQSDQAGLGIRSGRGGGQARFGARNGRGGGRLRSGQATGRSRGVRSGFQSGPSPEPPQLSSEPTYDRQPLSVWLNIVLRERNDDVVRDALKAIDSLGSDETNEQITQSLLQAGRATPSWGPREMHLLFSSLWMANLGDKYVPLLVAELEAADDVWKLAILKDGLEFARRDVSPLLDWIDLNILLAAEESPLVKEAAAAYIKIITDEYQLEPDKDHAVETLKNSAWLGRAFWFGSATEQSGSPSLDTESIRRARAVVLDEDSDNADFSSALIRLSRQLAASQADNTLVEVSGQDELAEALTKRLRNFDSDTADNTAWDQAGLVEIANRYWSPDPRKYRQATDPRWEHRLDALFLRESNQTIASELIVMLDLVSMLEPTDAMELDLVRIDDDTEAGYDRIAAFYLKHSVGQARLLWPSLLLDNVTPLPTDGGPQASEIPGPSDWFDYLVHVRTSHMLERFNETTPSDASVGTIDGRVMRYAVRMIDRYDQDRDGRLSSPEMEQMLTSPLPDADMNQDRFVSVEEYARYIESRRRDR